VGTEVKGKKKECKMEESGEKSFRQSEHQSQESGENG